MDLTPLYSRVKWSYVNFTQVSSSGDYEGLKSEDGLFGEATASGKDNLCKGDSFSLPGADLPELGLFRGQGFTREGSVIIACIL